MRVLATYRRLLRNGPLTRLLFGEFVSSIGDWLYLVALLIVVYEQSGSPVLLGVIGAARVVPYIVLSVPAGIVADRFDRRLILLTTDVARGVIMLALAALVALDGPLAVFVGLAIFAACFSAFFGPAIGSLVPTLVTDETELGPANSAWASLDNLATVVGPAVGALLIATGGLPLAFLLNAVSFGIVAAVLLRLPSSRPGAGRSSGATGSGAPDGADSVDDPGQVPIQPAASGSGSPAAPLRGLVRPLGGMTVINVVAAFVFGGLGVLTVVVAADVIGGGEAATGYLNAALGLGGLLGAIASGVLVLGRRLSAPLVGGGLVLGAGMALVGRVDSLLPAVLVLTIASAGSLITEVVSMTIFQRVVPDELRGRVLGVMETLTVAGYAGGSLLIPVAAAVFDLPTVLLVSGVAIAVATLVGLLMLGPHATIASGIDPLRRRFVELPIFGGLPPARLEAAARQLERVEVRAGEAVIREGAVADRFYLILEGTFRVTQHRDGQERELRTMSRDQVFGEIGLLTGGRRTASVTAATDGVLLALEGPAFLELVGSGPGLTSTLLDLHRGATAAAAG